MNEINVNNQSSTEMENESVQEKLNHSQSRFLDLSFSSSQFQFSLSLLDLLPIAAGDALLSLVDLRRRGHRSSLESPRTANNRSGEI